MAEASDSIVDTVGHVGVVAARGAVPRRSDVLIGEELAVKLVDAQVRPLAWFVDGEEAQAVDRYPMKVVEHVLQQLAGALRGGVRGDRFAHRVGLGEGNPVVISIDRRGEAVRRKTYQNFKIVDYFELR
ncbi:hypothetical protein GGP63_003168 [Salinibacter ruber]|nr:hypothetical protein [Salinibacter ruber]MCS3648565.1 hypothetical protein [Salinibacter ruber]